MTKLEEEQMIEIKNLKRKQFANYCFIGAVCFVIGLAVGGLIK